MTRTFVYEPYGVWVAMAERIDSPDDIWMVRVRHIPPNWKFELEEHQSFFYVEGIDQEKWDRIVKSLSHLHHISEWVAPKEPVDEWIVENYRAPTYHERFEALLRIIGVEPYWPCCWVGFVDNLMGLGEKALVCIGATSGYASADIIFPSQKPVVLFPMIKPKAELRIHILYHEEGIEVVFGVGREHARNVCFGRSFKFPLDELLSLDTLIDKVLSLDTLKALFFLGYFD